MQASLIIVYSSTGRTARLVAKYRPSMPILTLVIPHLTATNSLKWQLSGRSLARQTLIIRGTVSPPTMSSQCTSHTNDRLHHATTRCTSLWLLALAAAGNLHQCTPSQHSTSLGVVRLSTLSCMSQTPWSSFSFSRDWATSTVWSHRVTRTQHSKYDP